MQDEVVDCMLELMDDGADPISLVVSPKTRVTELKSNTSLQCDVDETACTESVGASGRDVFTEMVCQKARVTLQAVWGEEERVDTQ